MKFTDFSDFTKKYPNERVQVFIDGANLYEAKNDEIPGHTIDYHKLGLKLVGNRKIIRINYYISELNPEWDDGAKNQQRFLAAIKHLRKECFAPRLGKRNQQATGCLRVV